MSLSLSVLRALAEADRRQHFSSPYNRTDIRILGSRVSPVLAGARCDDTGCRDGTVEMASRPGPDEVGDHLSISHG
jgi:hypothetical protein